MHPLQHVLWDHPDDAPALRRKILGGLDGTGVAPGPGGAAAAGAGAGVAQASFLLDGLYARAADAAAALAGGAPASATGGAAPPPAGGGAGQAAAGAAAAAVGLLRGVAAECAELEAVLGGEAADLAAAAEVRQAIDPLKSCGRGDRSVEELRPRCASRRRRLRGGGASRGFPFWAPPGSLAGCLGLTPRCAGNRT